MPAGRLTALSPPCVFAASSAERSDPWPVLSTPVVRFTAWVSAVVFTVNDAADRGPAASARTTPATRKLRSASARIDPPKRMGWGRRGVGNLRSVVNLEWRKAWSGALYHKDPSLSRAYVDL